MTGKLDDTHISQVWFKDGNIIESSFHFGCGIFYNPKINANPLSFLTAFSDSSD